MPTIVWPATLPQEVLFDGYDEKMPNRLLRTQMDAGPAKVRRRFTAAIRTISFNIEMTRAQVVLFDTFFNDTLKGGSLAFEWVHPRTQAACTYRFTEPPAIQLVTGALCKVVCKMEILP